MNHLSICSILDLLKNKQQKQVKELSLFDSHPQNAVAITAITHSSASSKLTVSKTSQVFRICSSFLQQQNQMSKMHFIILLLLAHYAACGLALKGKLKKKKKKKNQSQPFLLLLLLLPWVFMFLSPVCAFWVLSPNFLYAYLLIFLRHFFFFSYLQRTICATQIIYLIYPWRSHAYIEWSLFFLTFVFCCIFHGIFPYHIIHCFNFFSCFRKNTKKSISSQQ